MPAPKCYRHADAATDIECARCSAPVCPRCVSRKTGRTLCLDCGAETAPSAGPSRALTVVLLVLALPIAVPALLLWLVARRWRRIPMIVYAVACFAGLAAAILAAGRALGCPWEFATGAGFLSFVASMIFFARETARGGA